MTADLLEVAGLRPGYGAGRGAARHRPHGRAGRGRRRPRRQRRRQDDHHAGDLRHDPRVRARSCSTARTSPRRRPTRSCALGIAQVPQGRGTFPELTVEDNLRIGALHPARRRVDADIDRWYETFPRLRERRDAEGRQPVRRRAADARHRPGADEPAHAAACDEPRLGLAPLITQELFGSRRAQPSEEGIAVLLVEQNANLAARHRPPRLPARDRPHRRHRATPSDRRRRQHPQGVPGVLTMDRFLDALLPRPVVGRDLRARRARPRRRVTAAPATSTSPRARWRRCRRSSPGRRQVDHRRLGDPAVARHARRHGVRVRPRGASPRSCIVRPLERRSPLAVVRRR